jgi:hypothetical protein
MQWIINVLIEPDGIEKEIEIVAANCEAAVIMAMNSLQLRQDQLIHDIHISRPRDNRARPNPYRDLTSKLDFIRLLSERDETIKKLRNMTIDDHIRELVINTMNNK